MRLAVLACALVGCIEPSLVTCEDGLACAPGLACDEAHHQCVRPDQFTACDGLPDHHTCTTTSLSGECLDGVCIEPGCGNGILEAGEVCDDGNRESGDGCSSDCLSTETCGNGHVDSGEECDDGNLMSRDGCDSRCLVEQTSWRTVLLPTLGGLHWTFDVAHRVVGVLQGSTAWSLDGSTWSSTAIPNAQYTSYYDTKCGCLGGFGLYAAQVSNYLNTGSTWSVQGSHPLSPTESLLAATYDSTLHRAVLVTSQHHVIAYDGTTWQDLPDFPASTDYGVQLDLAFQPALNRIIALVPKLSNASAGYELDFDGTSWTSTAQPFWGSLAYNSATQQLFALSSIDGSLYVRGAGPAWTAEPNGRLPTGCGTGWYGGDPTSTTLYFDANASALTIVTRDSTMCTWNGQWTAEHRIPGPISAIFASPSGDSLIMYSSSGLDEDAAATTWRWNGAWTLLPTAHVPPYRSTPLTFTTPGRSVLAQGLSDTYYCHSDSPCATSRTDTWAFDGTDWSPLPALPFTTSFYVQPSPWRAVLLRQQTGQTVGTYELGTADSVPVQGPVLVLPQNVPGLPLLAWSAADSALYASYGTIGSIFEQTNGTWSQLPLQPIGAFGFANDLRTGGLVLYDLTGTKLWDLTRNGFVRGSDLPMPVASFRPVYVPATGQLVFGASGALLIRERTSATPLESCEPGVDRDGDGLAGCADPDCWWACPPVCAPFTSC